MNKSVWEILQSHEAMWVILALSVVAMTVALERLIVQWGFMDKARALADTVTRCLSRGALNEGRSACERSRSSLADVFLVGYERLGRTKTHNVHAAVNRERMRVTTALKSHLWIIGTIGATAPFVGLFGTVIGIMDAFGDISEAGGGGMAVVSGGISVALYATAAGILVAVLAVMLFNFFNQRLARISIELRMLTDEFLELLDEFEPEALGAALSSDADADAGDEDDGSTRRKKDGTREAA